MHLNDYATNRPPSSSRCTFVTPRRPVFRSAVGWRVCPVAGPTEACPCGSGAPFSACHGIEWNGPEFLTHAEAGNWATEIALQLVAEGPVHEPDEFKFCIPAATAVVIAPHVALTAKHVILDYAERYGFPVETNAQNAGTNALSALMTMADGRTGAMLNVTRVSLCPQSDLALLRLGSPPAPSPFTEWRVPILTLFPPCFGDRVLACGYHDAQADLQTRKLRRSFSSARGEVLDIFLERRDRVMAPFPCFVANCRADGGMSGGPVFDDAGRLCGVVVANMPPDEPGGEHVTTVATLLPLVAMPVDLGRADQPLRMEFAYGLMRDGTIRVDPEDMRSLDVTIDGDSLTCGARVPPGRARAL
jgi:hypothetical protein